MSETYWQTLQYMKEQGVIDQLMDSVQLEMFNASSTKEEFASKLTNYASKAGQGLSVSFANGVMTLVQNGTSVTMDYVECDGKIYVKSGGKVAVLYYVDSTNNFIYEYTENLSNDGNVVYTTTKHVWTTKN